MLALAEFPCRAAAHKRRVCDIDDRDTGGR